MYGYNGYTPPYQQNAQQGYNRPENVAYGLNPYQNSYSPVNMQAQTQNGNTGYIKGRPVSSYDEAKASMIDLDGSLFVFTDVANKRIYTKQIMLDGSAELKTYVLEEQNTGTNAVEQNKEQYVLRSDFENVVNRLTKQIEALRKEGAEDE